MTFASKNSSLTNVSPSGTKISRVVQVYVPRHEDTELVDWFSAGRSRFISVNRALEGVVFTDNPAHADIIVLFEDWYNDRSWNYSRKLRQDPLLGSYLTKTLCY